MRIEDYMLSRTFIEVPLFTRRWKEIGLTDKELTALQLLLLKDPQSGPVMEGTGGIRKVRFPLENRGKSGSVRVCYTDCEEYEVIYLIKANPLATKVKLADLEHNSDITRLDNVTQKDLDRIEKYKKAKAILTK